MAERSLGGAYRRLFGASTISNLGDGISQIAWPWLASAVTRNGLLIAAVAVAQRLPWLLFSLPAGVITDRHERRKLMVGANVVRSFLTMVVAIVVWRESGGLPGPDEVAAGAGTTATNWLLYATVLAATSLLGIGEVLYDNSAQTLMPSLVHADDLERANGRLWGAEQTMNDLAGPALGALLLALAFPAPFFVDGLTFALSAALIWSLPATGSPVASDSTTSMRADMAEGMRWLWRHSFLRPLAITLGLLNGFSMIGMATLVLFAQEILHASPLEFALMLTGTAGGAIAGGWTASWLSRALGPGRSLLLTLLVSGTTSVLIGFSSNWLIVWALFAISMFFAVLWNVITVSLRQTIIPDHLLGRVNSVYRFIAWGSMPIGAGIGGLLVVIGETMSSRAFGLRLPWIVSGVLQLLLIAYAAQRLTSDRIAQARAAADRLVEDE